MTILTRLLPALALALLLAACSDSDSDRAAAPAASPSPRAAATASPGAQPAQPPVTSASQRGAQIFDPSAFTLALEPVLSGLRQPTYVASPPDGSGRLFVVERGGTIRVAENGRVLPQPFLDVTALITSQGQEQGLLGLAFHPRYAENGRFFVMYTARDGGANTVARYQVSADSSRADPASATILLSIEDFASNHNGGMLAFGPDGYLYVGTGDGGQGGDPRGNGQNRGALLGKLLRLDVDAGEPYATPPDNPFAGQRDARPEVWAYGLRNPWRFAFDRATGDLWIADVGQGAWEEIDLQPA